MDNLDAESVPQGLTVNSRRCNLRAEAPPLLRDPARVESKDSAGRGGLNPWRGFPGAGDGWSHTDGRELQRAQPLPPAYGRRFSRKKRWGWPPTVLVTDPLGFAGVNGSSSGNQGTLLRSSLYSTW